MQTLMQPGTTADSATSTSAIVVATDGLPQSRGALAMARALAGPLHGTINVVAVHQSIAMMAPDGQLLLDPNVTASLRADLTRRVREQCTAGAAADAPIADCAVLNGEPARVINDVATSRKAQLIIVGLGRHELVDRLFGDETALKVARSSHLPVLAVPEGDVAAPRHAVAAIDFSEVCDASAQMMVAGLGDRGVLERDAQELADGREVGFEVHDARDQLVGRQPERIQVGAATGLHGRQRGLCRAGRGVPEVRRAGVRLVYDLSVA